MCRATRCPLDFAKISVNDPKANVLVSVPGTPQAKEAAIAATIPQTATVSRAKAMLNVTYAGPPKFEPIAGTSMAHAVNTPTPVIEVGARSLLRGRGRCVVCRRAIQLARGGLRTPCQM